MQILDNYSMFVQYLRNITYNFVFCTSFVATPESGITNYVMYNISFMIMFLTVFTIIILMCLRPKFNKKLIEIGLI